MVWYFNTSFDFLVDKDIGMEDSLKAEAEDEDELMKKEAADLLTAQLDLLQYFGSSDKQLTIDQSHLNAQVVYLSAKP